MNEETRTSVEKAVVGCMLIDSRAIDEFTAQGGDPSWFADPTCRTVAGAICQRYADGRVASDLIAVRQAVGSGVSAMWLDECIELVPTVAETLYYVGLLKGYADKDALEGLQRAVSSIVSHCTPETVQEARASIEAAVSAAMRQDTNEIGTMREAGHALIDRMTAPDAETTLMDWPVRSITDAVGRISRDVVWICAQPSAGKTAFVLNLASQLASQGRKIALASMESDRESIAGRLIASSAPMSTTSLRQGRATPEEIAKARDAADKLSENIIVTSGSMTIDVACSWGRAQVRAGAEMLIFDNARHVIVAGANGRVDEMAVMSSRFKQLRDQCEVPVIILHHSKVDEHGNEGVAWSSDVLKDTDLLVFLRPDKDQPDKISFNLKKNREGESGISLPIRFDKDTQRFSRWVDDPFITKEESGFTSEKLFDNE
jgi:replicative DNA helicase